MTKQFGQALLLGFLLLLVCLVRLDAKSTRGVRGSRVLATTSSNAVGQIYLRNLNRALQETFKKNEDEDEDDKEQDDKEDEFPQIENAEGDEEDEKEEDDKNQDNKNNKDEEEEEEPEDDKNQDDKDEEEEETEEPEEVEETLEPTDPPKEDDDEETEETDAPEPEVETETEEGSVVETESPLAPEDVVEETSDPAVELSPDAEVIETVASDDAAMNATDMYTVALAPFTIELDYEETITEDPGIEMYLTLEMMRGGANNLEDVELDMTVAAGDERRRLQSQVLSYTGTATFVGPPVHEEAAVQTLQTQILSNEQKVSSVIAISLGEHPANFTVVTVELATDAVDAEGTADVPQEPAEEGLSTTGLAIIIVAAVVGGISLTIICLVAIKKPEKKLQPYAGVDQSLKASSKAPVEAKKTADEGKKEDLNKTFDTEEDEVRDEFADKMEKHNFDGSWKKDGSKEGTGSVRMLASVGRGSFHESDNEADGEQPDDIKEELGHQLSELQASVKAAREKTQKLLEESKA